MFCTEKNHRGPWAKWANTNLYKCDWCGKIIDPLEEKVNKDYENTIRRAQSIAVAKQLIVRAIQDSYYEDQGIQIDADKMLEVLIEFIEEENI